MIDICCTTQKTLAQSAPFSRGPLDPMFRRVIGRPASQHANVEGYAGSAATERHAWETRLMDTITYVGSDVHKATVSVAVAESGPRR